MTVSVSSGLSYDELDVDLHDHDHFDHLDPDVGPPSPEAWLALDEDERFQLLSEAHSPLPQGHPPLPNSNVHISFHVIVENQLAMNEPPQVRAALTRLMNDGLERHDAVHAIACLVADALADAVHEGSPFSTESYATALAEITPESWRLMVAEEEKPKSRRARGRGKRGGKRKRGGRRKKR